MLRFIRISLVTLVGTLGSLAVGAEEVAEKPAAEPVKAEDSNVTIEEKAKEIRRRTTTYDAASIRELYEKMEKRKAEAAKRAPDHLNTDEMDLFILEDKVVEGYKLRNERELLRKMDPQPGRALDRLAVLDPELANQLLVARRADEAFMAGEFEAGRNGDAGRTANLSATQILEAFQRAEQATKRALGGKREAAADE